MPVADSAIWRNIAVLIDVAFVVDVADDVDDYVIHDYVIDEHVV